MQRLAHRLRNQYPVKRITVKRRQARHRRRMSGCNRQLMKSGLQNPGLALRRLLVAALRDALSVSADPQASNGCFKGLGGAALLGRQSREIQNSCRRAAKNDGI